MDAACAAIKASQLRDRSVWVFSNVLLATAFLAAAVLALALIF